MDSDSREPNLLGARVMSREAALNKIRAYLGCWGAKTSMIESDGELVLIARRLYEVDDLDDPGQVAAEIESMGKKRRKELAAKNIPLVFPSPDPIWPDDIPLRGGHRADGSGSLSQAQMRRMMEASEPRLIDGEPFGIDWRTGHRSRSLAEEGGLRRHLGGTGQDSLGIPGCAGILQCSDAGAGGPAQFE